MNADDLVSVVFPDQLACPENLAGDREVPDHPLVEQTLRDCLEEAMDVAQLEELLRRMRAGELTLLGRDVAEPSPLAQEILNARPYAFLDDAPLEERRTQAVLSRRWLDPETASDLGALDAAAIDAVRAEAWPQAQSADELHEALVLAGFLTDDEIPTRSIRRAARLRSSTSWWLRAGHAPARRRARRLGRRRAVWRRCARSPGLDRRAGARPARRAARDLDRRGRAGRADAQPARDPRTGHGARALAELARAVARRSSSTARSRASKARASRCAAASRRVCGAEEWCERGLLARIHRRTLHRLRAEIEPVSTEAYLRFLLAWQHVADGERKAGPRGLEEVVAQLEGFEVAAGSWEVDVLPDRVEDYEREWLDALGNAGKVVWQRRTLPAPARSPTDRGRSRPS